MDRLADTVADLIQSDEPVYYCDRHVRDVGADPAHEMESACHDVVEMLRAWTLELESIADVHASEPVAIIDEDWLQRRASAPPPHVWICLSKTPEGVSELPRSSERPVVRAGIDVLDGFIDTGYRVSRIEADPSDPDSTGSWHIRAPRFGCLQDQQGRHAKPR